MIRVRDFKILYWILVRHFSKLTPFQQKNTSDKMKYIAKHLFDDAPKHSYLRLFQNYNNDIQLSKKARDAFKDLYIELATEQPEIFSVERRQHVWLKWRNTALTAFAGFFALYFPIFEVVVVNIRLIQIIMLLFAFWCAGVSLFMYGFYRTVLHILSLRC